MFTYFSSTPASLAQIGSGFLSLKDKSSLYHTHPNMFDDDPIKGRKITRGKLEK